MYDIPSAFLLFTPNYRCWLHWGIAILIDPKFKVLNAAHYPYVSNVCLTDWRQNYGRCVIYFLQGGRFRWNRGKFVACARNSQRLWPQPEALNQTQIFYFSEQGAFIRISNPLVSKGVDA